MKLIDKIEDFLDFPPTLDEKDHTKDAVAFMKDIKSKIDKSIKELESNKFGAVGSTTSSLVGKMARINDEDWYKGLFK